MDTFVPKGNISGPILPEFVLKLTITSGAKLLYAVLCSHAYNKDHCWPSYGKLAERIGCSINTIKNHLKELVEQKLIAIERVSYHSSKFFMLTPPAAMQVNVTKSASSECQNRAAPCDPSNIGGYPPKVDGYVPKSGRLNNLKKDKKENYSPIQPTEAPISSDQPVQADGGGVILSDFEKVFAAYPRKEAKGLAKAAWISMARNKTLPAVAEILASITRFIGTANWKRENGRFIPQLCNFLKGERWNDPIPDDERTEALAKEKAVKLQKLYEAEEEKRKAEHNELRKQYEPAFKAFAQKFNGSFPYPMVFGLWLHLARQGKAPLAEDVPNNNSLPIYEFLKTFSSLQKKNEGYQTSQSPSVTTAQARWRLKSPVMQISPPENTERENPVSVKSSITSLLADLTNSAGRSGQPDLACVAV